MLFKTNRHVLHFDLTVENELEESVLLYCMFQLQRYDFFFYKVFKDTFISFKSANLKLFKENQLNLFLLNLSFRFNLMSDNKLCIGVSNKNKFYWTNFSYSPVKFFNLSKNNFCFFKLYNNSIDLKKSDLIKLNVNLKKNFGILKRKDRFIYNNLIKANTLKNYKILHQHNINPNEFKSAEFSKIFEFKRKLFRIFKINRFLAKNIFLQKSSRQFSLTKFFKKNSNKNTLKVFKNLESSLLFTLIKAKFVFTIKESLFLIKKKFVFVNGVVVTDPFYVITLYDIVNIIFTPKYYNFFKSNFNSKLKLTFLLGYRLWRYNRFRNNFYKQSPTHLPIWINKLEYFFSDIPSYFEVDYFTLCCSVIKQYNLNNLLLSNKFINFYMFRLYNWKYIN